MAENEQSVPKLDLKPVVRPDQKSALNLEAQKGSSRKAGEQKSPEMTETDKRKDHLNVKNDRYFKTIKSESEEITFSGEAEAWIPDQSTMYFVLTTETAYIVNPGREACLPFLRRKPKVEIRLPFEKVEGVLQSTTSGEFLLFAPMALDLRLRSAKYQDEIVESVKLALSVFAASQSHAKIIKEIDEKLGTSARYGKLSKNRHFIARDVVTFLVKNRMAIDREHAVHTPTLVVQCHMFVMIGGNWEQNDAARLHAAHCIHVFRVQRCPPALHMHTQQVFYHVNVGNIQRVG
uniref:Uncharacterized protein n=1 Tax=Lotharella oceanica TaxID=641309 RepID=A0A7S2U2K5_9EUKA|mmetsp:Transcript_4424/g.8868  ORF Transcript_4424/g.8868 Transcript_4424/m.8868 type:complete len:291 (+) Transcript_4424:38-910(+)